MEVTFGLVNFGSPIIERLEREILPTIAHYPQGVFEILCVDNDPIPQPKLMEFLSELKVPVRYLWNGGANAQVAAAKNQLYANASHPILVYTCANHGKMYDPTWLEDLIRPLENPKVAMAGTMRNYEFSSIGAGPGRGKFIQGAVLAARVEALRKNPMSDQFPHAHSDKWICRKLVTSGYKLAHVSSILSLWRKEVPLQNVFKYVHFT